MNKIWFPSVSIGVHLHVTIVANGSAEFGLLVALTAKRLDAVDKASIDSIVAVIKLSKCHSLIKINNF